MARMALLLAGLPVTVPGETVNRLCASGMSAVANAARAVQLGEGDFYIAGGVESMTRAPYVMSQGEQAVRARHRAVRHQSRLALRQPEDEGDVRHRLDGPDRGERGRAVRGQPRRPGRVRGALAAEGGRGARRWPLRARDRAVEIPQQKGRAEALRPGRVHSPRHDARDPGQAASRRSAPTARGR